ncbi:transporter substrate-binding domain-containing protein [Aureimonas mangrovi]|uniref:transporter substrate-binding domain-containing protein n=1 Tax=Aureimonas mangrovi TaxID=2758041 RepID=UPI00163D767A|nr:transporter substrate-binding domain-containing protein [Aureimonas mangrovi]
MKMFTKTALMAGATLVALTSFAHADRLEDIRAAGKVRIAVAMGIPQYSYVDGNLNATGSDVETARLIAEDLGVELELVEITNAARVPTIQTGRADILVSALGITEERKQAVDYTVPYATLSIIVAAPAAEEIASYEDLTGKRIGVTRATTNDQDITAKTSGAEILRFEDDATLITAVVSGQIDIISSQSAVLGGINERRAGEPLETKFTQAETNLGIAIAKGEDNLREWLNEWVTTNFENDRLREVFREFHDRELPDDLLSRG